jgi:hypothetical protein
MAQNPCIANLSDTSETCHSVDKDVLELIGATKQACPTFIVPKIAGTVQWVSSQEFKVSCTEDQTIYILQKLTCPLQHLQHNSWKMLL